MTPVPAIAAVDSVVQAASKTVASPALDELAHKFDAMMKPSHGASPPVSPATEPLKPNEGVTALTNAMSNHGMEMREVTADAHEFATSAGHLTVNEMMARSMEISQRMTILSVKMTATTSVANNSNKSLQSLLKNQ